MKNTLALFALAAGLSQVTATGFHNAPSYTSPDNSDNQCTDAMKGGFDWTDLNFGDFNSYKGFQYSGYQCTQKFGKRDTLTGRSFQSKCITGKATGDRNNSPKISCDKSTVEKTSIREFQVTPEFDCDLEFHYTMPDGSNCKHRSSCKSTGTVVKNTQCGGATDVTIVYPEQPDKPKGGCNYGIHHIGFDCDAPKPTKQHSYPVNTPTYPANSPSSPASTPASTPSLPETTTEPATYPGSTPAESTPAESTPAESTPAESTPAESTPAESTPAESTPAESTPAESTPAESTPAESTPAESTPAESSTIGSSSTAPVTSPSVTPPASSVPGSYPVYTPSTTAPAESTPAESTPAESTPVESTPAESTPAESTPAESTPAESTPAESTPAESTPAESTPAESTPAESTPAESTPAESTPAESTPAESTPVGSSSTAAVSTPAETPIYSVTSYITTSTVFTTSVQTITSCGPEVPNCPAGSTAVTTVTIPISTTVCPVTETISQPATTPIPTPIETGSVPATYPASSPVESTPIASSVTSPASQTSSGPSYPVETLPCPGVVPSCLNTWMFAVGCKDNTDSACYCPDNDFVNNIFACLYAHGESDEVISEAVSYFQGICAPFVPSNPGIATGAETITTVLTVTPTQIASYTTIEVIATTVVPCTDAVGEVIPSSSSTVVVSTAMTVPQVIFTTISATGTDSSSVAVIPGTYPAFTPTPTGNATPAPYPTGSAGITTFTTSPSAGLPATTPATTAPIQTAGASHVGAGLGFMGMMAVVIAAL
ncbi:putative adhesin protein Mad1 [Rosellinia necatrix]|uniref:Putative adhesin protein Mad1 n=1 Tax=Rosellinia necatrix TaxID=77044 RepID=A0A1W2TIS3_ROSNE|nr:putative adhesin protein Mad1 [Rosellinia necatrix]